MSKRWYELLMDDHAVTEKLFAAMEKALELEGGPGQTVVAKFLDFVMNYSDKGHSLKEEDYLFPLLQERGIPAEGGPLGVMLMEHERQRELVAVLRKHGGAYVHGDKAALEPFTEAFQEYSTLCKDHFWKENDILYPMAIKVMSPEDEESVIRGIEATEAKLGEGCRERYYGLAESLAQRQDVKDLSFNLDRDVLALMLNTLPVELSFVDADDRVQYFSHEDKDKIFPRNRSAIGQTVQQCHPKKSVHKVNKILEDFKAGKQSVAEFWIDFRDMKVYIRYFAVHDREGRYIGCMEVVQDVAHIQKLEGQRVLLDEE